MAIELEVSPTKEGDTVANHGTETSGNATFLSLWSVKTAEKPEDIADIDKDIRKLDVGYLSLDAKSLAEVVSEQLERTEGYLIALPRSSPVITDVRVLIDRETDRLNVLSDPIGPALLSVLNVHGPLSAAQMLESLDITSEVLLSHLETLQRTELVVTVRTLHEGHCYSVTEEGIEFLRDLGLEEEDR